MSATPSLVVITGCVYAPHAPANDPNPPRPGAAKKRLRKYLVTKLIGRIAA